MGQWLNLFETQLESEAAPPGDSSKKRQYPNGWYLTGSPGRGPLREEEEGTPSKTRGENPQSSGLPSKPTSPGLAHRLGQGDQASELDC